MDLCVYGQHTASPLVPSSLCHRVAQDIAKRYAQRDPTRRQRCEFLTHGPSEGASSARDRGLATAAVRSDRRGSDLS
jgi:hypothetical protein